MSLAGPLPAERLLGRRVPPSGRRPPACPAAIAIASIATAFILYALEVGWAAGGAPAQGVGGLAAGPCAHIHAG